MRCDAEPSARARVVLVSTDAAAASGLVVAPLPAAEQRRLGELIPGPFYGTTENPVDVTGSISRRPEAYAEVVTELAGSPSVDEVAVFLFQNIGRLLSRKHLLEAVWGIEAEVSSRSLDTHVSRLRSKLGLVPENGYRLAAIYSVGYRLELVNPGSAPAPGAAATTPEE